LINVNEFKSQPFAGSVIVKDQGSNSSGYMIRCGGNGIINFNIGNGSWHEINSPANSVQLNSWHHVAATYDGASMKIYVDGELAVQSTMAFTIGNAANSNLFVGESPGFPGRVFNGKIDEVRVWNVVRTQSQIQSTMNTILTSEYYSTPDSGLAGYWRMDEGTGQTVEDLSFYSNTATLGASTNPDASDPTWVQANILIVNVEEESSNRPVPTNFSLAQNYPNPFNPSTKISWQSPVSTHQSLIIYNVLGKEVETLISEYKPAGKYEIIFNADGLPSGVYFYQLKADSFVETRKMILIK